MPKRDLAASNVRSDDIVRFVKAKDGSSKIGLVVRRGGISDSEDSCCSSEEDVKVGNDELLVCWYPSGHEQTISESKVCQSCVMLYFYLVKHLNTWQLDNLYRFLYKGVVFHEVETGTNLTISLINYSSEFFSSAAIY